MRSRMPPWPGSMVPESLTPAPRLMADSRRSPSWAAMLRMAARRRDLPEGLGDVKDGVAAGGEQVARCRRRAQAASTLPRMEAMEPSQVLPGLRRGASLCLPKARPM